MSRRPQGQLRKGWTTGACATAAAHAAYEAVLSGAFPDPVTITLPKGERPSFALAETQLTSAGAMAAIIKDAGDDPDVTHGAKIMARVALAPAGTGVSFHAGDGVGTVTRPGLGVAVGEPAINPGPRRMIEATIAELAQRHGVPGDVDVTLSIPGGEEMAAKTANRRLGILGGLSVLGTTGIVKPYSCSAWICSIQSGIDVARAEGFPHIAAATGSTSERAVAEFYGLQEAQLIDMGDFAGGVLKYLRRYPVPWLTIAGGFAKLAKLGDGHLDLHSEASQVDVRGLATLLEDVGGTAEMVARAEAAASAGEILMLAGKAAPDLALAVANRARAVALETIAGETKGRDIKLDVTVFDRKGKLIGHAGP